MGLRVAERWFERSRLSDGVTLLWEPHVDPWIRCNIWHVGGRERDLLVDSGLGAAPLRPALEGLLGRPAVAVATHVHYDHVGGLHEFDTRLVHRAEAAQMEDYREFATLLARELPEAVRAAIAAAGDAVPELLVDALPSADFEVAGYRVRSTRVTRRLEEGDVIDLGDRAFEVLHLPGHTPGSIGLWEPASGILFSGDAVYDGPLLDTLPESDVPAYLRSMRRLRELPVRVVHAGHEPSFGRERLRELIDAYLRRRGA